ncbi:hypothetical protein [Microbulbifer sp. GL-2]|uniref:hypothetical protein n=1 Tax=Microbulbifer sp. GL-2 TaxID=2591606 RepID=UPI001161F190|nr:hypothetical protein [Microbulbifer sp. GL-2]BBM02899.1 hypothetical protein GL2_29730 [Microbulbifer sp. GL-2]
MYDSNYVTEKLLASSSFNNLINEFSDLAASGDKELFSDIFPVGDLSNKEKMGLLKEVGEQYHSGNLENLFSNTTYKNLISSSKLQKLTNKHVGYLKKILNEIPLSLSMIGDDQLKKGTHNAVSLIMMPKLSKLVSGDPSTMYGDPSTMYGDPSTMYGSTSQYQPTLRSLCQQSLYMNITDAVFEAAEIVLGGLTFYKNNPTEWYWWHDKIPVGGNIETLAFEFYCIVGLGVIISKGCAIAFNYADCG